MRHEKIFNREDGSKVMVDVSLYTDGLRNKFHWDFNVAIKGKGKKTWFYNHYEKATKEEIQETKLELWELIKPKIEVC